MKRIRNKLNFDGKELAIGILAVMLISITIFAINKDNKDSEDSKVVKTYVGFNEKGLKNKLEDSNYETIISSIEEIDSGNAEKAKEYLSEMLDDKDISNSEIENFSRDDAVKSLQEIIRSVKNDVDGEDRSLEERIEALGEEDVDIDDILSEETIDGLYMSEEFESVKFNRQFTASSLLIYYDLVETNTDDDELTPRIPLYDEIVYLDERFLTAHIPLDVFIGSSTGIAFEMQYIDGEWKLNPYTSMMSLNLMGIISSDVEAEESEE